MFDATLFNEQHLTNSEIHVLVADHHPIYREHCARLLKQSHTEISVTVLGTIDHAV